jgi:hypothetical protein
MNQDPLFQAIVDALANRNIDGDSFQLAAGQLLQSAYPNLAIMTGGDDAGMDGAITGGGSSYPLIATVSKTKVLGNVKRNLKQYLEKRPHGARRAVVATSAKITNKQRRNIEEAGRSLGVVIENIHERTDIAVRLYSNPDVCKALLGIAGNPPALSVLPRRGRRIVSPSGVFGREAALDWLRASKADLLLVGQPGSGKTFLHQQLALEGKCLFAVDGEPVRLAEAIRSQQPSAIVVDDAHANAQLLDSLIYIREQTGAKFAIHANGWPRMSEPIAHKLRLARHQVLSLEPLEAEVMVEFIKANGVSGPDLFVHFLIKQSEGKPGLAIAVIDAFMRDDGSDLSMPEVMANELIRSDRIIKDRRERTVLAAFALAGDAGFPPETVGDALRMSAADVLSIVVNLGGGGLIDAVSDRNLQVRPEMIRGPLIADVFFGPEAIDPLPLIQASRSPSSTAHALMWAAWTNGRVSLHVIEELIRQSTDPELWQHFATISKEASYRVLRAYPNRVCAAALGILNHAVKDGLDALLRAYAHANPGDLAAPGDQIESWLLGNEMETAEAPRRRAELFAALERFAASCDAPGRVRTIAWVAGVFLNPGFHYSRQRPGKGDQFVYVSGIVDEEQLNVIVGLRSRLFDLLRRTVGVEALRPLLEPVEDWCFPIRLSNRLPASAPIAQLMRDTGKVMLSDLATWPGDSLALKSWVDSIASRASLSVEVQTDPVFELLYGDRIRTDWQQEHQERERAIGTLADQLVSRQPSDVFAELLALDCDARRIGRSGRQHWLHHEIARRSTDAIRWLDAGVAAEAPESFVQPYLRQAALQTADASLARLRQLVASERYQQIAVEQVIIGMDAPPDELLEAALLVLHPDRFQVWLGINRALPVATMKRLLTHPDTGIRRRAAFHEFDSQSSTVRSGLLLDWRAAILEVEHEDDFHLTRILSSDANLAFEWAREKLLKSSRLWSLDGPFATVVERASIEQRRQLLSLMHGDRYSDGLFDVLVGNETDLYAEWFLAEAERFVALRPLNRIPSARWERMACVALDCGALESEIAEHCSPRSTGVIAGPFSEYYRRLLPLYEQLLNHPDRRLHQAAEAGLDWARGNYEFYLQRERRQNVRGI